MVFVSNSGWVITMRGGGSLQGGKGGAPTYPGGFKTLRDASVIFGV